MTAQQYQQYIPFLVLIPIAAVVIFRNLKPRPLRLELLWIRPMIIMAMAVALLVYMPFPHQGYAVAALVGAFAAGALLGWMRGRMVRVQVDPETHMATSQSSPLGVLFILAIVGVKVFVHPAAGAAAATPEAMLITDALLLFGVGLVGVAGLEVWVRARRMIADSRAARHGPIVA